MLPTDRDKFDECMIGCFQNFRTAADDKLLDEWFRELKDFSMYAIEMSFRKYKREHERYAPTLAIIIKYAKLYSSEERIRLRDNRSNKCCVDNCFNEDIAEYCYDPSFMICKFHEDEMILKLDPQSPRASAIRGYKFYEDERLQLGLTGLQYVKMKDPGMFRDIKKMRERDIREAARKKVIRAVQDFYDTPLSAGERKKIVAELRDVAAEGANRVKCAENA